MDLIQNYWGFIPLIILLLVGIVRFINMPTEEQMEQVRKWLLWAVTQAEIKLGPGTHKLKLSLVYDMFVKRFPWLAKSITYDRFAKLVDRVLEDFNNMMATNAIVRDLVCDKAKTREVD